jgi:arginine N-succinyltransferase
MKLAVVRPSKIDDLSALIRFSEESGYGITSLPRNAAVLEKKLQASKLAFSEKMILLTHETYQFCLELDGQIIGTAGIISRIGMSETFFAYHLRYEHQISRYLGIDRQIPVLHFIQAHKKPTEIGSLFLLPTFHHKNLGKLLSLSRFLFISTFKNRFAPTVIAELRGVNQEGHSPFWEAVGRPFFQIDFPKADLLRTVHHGCIEELFPKHPLYVELLHKEAQEVIGKTHPSTLPAKKLLEKEGFKSSHYLDLFDGGPHMYAPTEEIGAIKNSKEVTLDRLDAEMSLNASAIIANTRLDYRATYAPILVEGDRAILHPEVAAALQVEIGDSIRYYIL